MKQNIRLTTESTKNFNEAFYLMNSSDINEDNTDYLLNIEKDNNYLNQFRFAAVSKFDYEKAVDLLTTIIEKDEQHTHALNLRAIAYLCLQAPSKAEDDLDNCINIDDLYTHAYHNLGIYYMDFDKNPEFAIQCFGDALELNPKMHKAHFNKAIAHSSIGEWQNTLDELTKLLQLNPNHEQLDMFMNTAIEKIVKIKSLVKELSEAIIKEPNDIKLYEKRSIAYKMLNKYAEMNSDKQKIAELKKIISNESTLSKIKGESAENPFDVQIVPEVYRIIQQNFSGYYTKKQSLRFINNRKYDVMEIENNLGTKRTLYFRYPSEN